MTATRAVWGTIFIDNTSELFCIENTFPDITSDCGCTSFCIENIRKIIVMIMIDICEYKDLNETENCISVYKSTNSSNYIMFPLFKGSEISLKFRWKFAIFSSRGIDKSWVKGCSINVSNWIDSKVKFLYVLSFH